MNDVTVRTQNEVLVDALGAVRKAMTEAALILRPDMRVCMAVKRSWGFSPASDAIQAGAHWGRLILRKR